MAKFRIKMKLQGLELEVEGNRDDVPVITHHLGSQLTGLLQSPGQIIEGKAPRVNVDARPTIVLEPRKGRRRRVSGGNGAVESEREEPLDWRHDPSKYGTPKQEWNTAQKAVWLLYVAGQEAACSEISGIRIAETFNKHFKQSGTIRAHNVNRDLGKLKVKKQGHPPVSEDTTKDPAVWFLTEEGIRNAQELIAQAIGQ